MSTVVVIDYIVVGNIQLGRTSIYKFHVSFYAIPYSMVEMYDENPHWAFP
jgi:hypothetical protein